MYKSLTYELSENMTPYKGLSLVDKPSFDRVLEKLQPETSDLTFTNLFMWQDSYQIYTRYMEDADYWLLLAKPQNKWNPFFLPPVGDWTDREKLERVLKFMDHWACEERFNLSLRRVPKRLAEGLYQIDPSLSLREDRRTFDYLYKSEDLVKLAGRNYHGKRNHLNQFQRKYNWEYQRMDSEILRECLMLDAEWCNIKNALRTDDNLDDEERAIAMVIQNYQDLGVVGGVIRIDGRIQAIAVGEMLNKNTAVIHIEKGNTEFEGIYAAINQQFASGEWANVEFINREEDMGLEGLRKAKLSYHPAQLIEKFSIMRPEKEVHHEA